jgi:hypothetical protein
MLASLIAPRVTGTYDFTVVPLALPSSLVHSLLPPSWTASSPFLAPAELEQQGLAVPSPGEVRTWVCVQVGRQIDTGMSLPGGRSTFFVRASTRV